MDFRKAIAELHEERKRLDRAVARLEAMVRESAGPQRSTRGRKNMPPEERLRVSRRMAEYWASRRLQKTEGI